MSSENQNVYNQKLIIVICDADENPNAQLKRQKLDDILQVVIGHIVEFHYIT